ncbi:MAG: sigma 54-interacting transcriptional regulator [Pseudomonadota bacterium]
MNQLQLKCQQIGSMFDFLSAGVIILSADHEVVHMNRTAELLSGKTAEDTLGHYCYDAFGDYLCDGDCALRESVALDRDVIHRRYEQAVGERHQIHKIVCPVYSHSGRLTGCIEIFQDTSAFTELVDRVGEESRKLKSILDHLDVGILSCDRGGHITSFNQMAETITGYHRQDLLGKRCAAVFDSDFCGLGHSTDAASVSADGNRYQEYRIRDAGGRPLPVRGRHIPLTNSDGQPTGRLITFSDLSLLYRYKSAIADRYTFHDMIGSAPAMQKLFDILPAVAESDAIVLIEGSTGTGKDLLAKVIHTASPRAARPLVKVNCAAMPDNLLESELFGYVKGAFTGADHDKPGRFQEADGGTIFLDEIGDLPLPLQAKLLRVLEDQEFYPLGSRQTTRVNVRIISATNLGLKELVQQKRFREDLYYRLNVMRVELPPLKERPSDIPLIIDHILKNLCMVKNRRIERIAAPAMAALLNHTYPGNVRELENILEHALIICRGAVIEHHHLPLHLQRDAAPPEPSLAPAAAEPGISPEPSSRPAPRMHEIDTILAALARFEGNRRQAAAALGIERTTLWRKMKKYGIGD